jgi:hypothetical protein
MIVDYIAIAKMHVNPLIDVLRHIGWMVKGCLSAEARGQLFQCPDMHHVRYVSLWSMLTGLIRILHRGLLISEGLQIPTLSMYPDFIVYPKETKRRKREKLKKITPNWEGWRARPYF